MLLRLHRRHMLTVAAIFFMVGSALLSFFFVQENDRFIMEGRRDEEMMDQNIRTLWEDAAQADRNADTAVVVSLLDRDGTPATADLKQYYLSRAGAGPWGTLMDIVKAAQKTRHDAVDAINDIYLKSIKIENDVMLRELANRRDASLAFFLQLISLVLVILTREMPG